MFLVPTQGQHLPDFILFVVICGFERHLIDTVLERLDLFLVGHQLHVKDVFRLQSALDLLAEGGLDAAEGYVLLCESGLGQEG